MRIFVSYDDGYETSGSTLRPTLRPEQRYIVKLNRSPQKSYVFVSSKVEEINSSFLKKRGKNVIRFKYTEEEVKEAKRGFGLRLISFLYLLFDALFMSVTRKAPYHGGESPDNVDQHYKRRAGMEVVVKRPYRKYVFTYSEADAFVLRLSPYKSSYEIIPKTQAEQLFADLVKTEPPREC